MKQIMIVKPSTLSSKDKEKLTKGGIIVIEHPFPGDVRLITPTDEVEGGMLLRCAAKAILDGQDTSTRRYFADNIAKELTSTIVKKS